MLRFGLIYHKAEAGDQPIWVPVESQPKYIKPKLRKRRYVPYFPITESDEEKKTTQHG